MTERMKVYYELGGEELYQTQTKVKTTEEKLTDTNLNILNMLELIQELALSGTERHQFSLELEALAAALTEEINYRGDLTRQLAREMKSEQ